MNTEKEAERIYSEMFEWICAKNRENSDRQAILYRDFAIKIRLSGALDISFGKLALSIDLLYGEYSYYLKKDKTEDSLIEERVRAEEFIKVFKLKER
jgi:hypothetical protein